MVRKAGMEHSMSSHDMRDTLRIVKTPTMIREGAVAAAGIVPAKGAKNTEARKRTPTTKELNPVRAPSVIPAEDSANVVTVEVPIQAPQQVAIASAIRTRL